MMASRAATIARSLAAVCAVLALVASVSATAGVAEATADTKFVEVWRLVGMLTFTALFAVLAVRPLGQSALWCTVIVSKAALTVAASVLGPSVQGASEALFWDGLLTVLLIAGFLFARRADRAQTTSPFDG